MGRKKAVASDHITGSGDTIKNQTNKNLAPKTIDNKPENFYFYSHNLIIFYMNIVL